MQQENKFQGVKNRFISPSTSFLANGVEAFSEVNSLSRTSSVYAKKPCQDQERWRHRMEGRKGRGGGGWSKGIKEADDNLTVRHGFHIYAHDTDQIDGRWVIDAFLTSLTIITT